MHFAIISLFDLMPRMNLAVFLLKATLKRYNHICSLIFLMWSPHDAKKSMHKSRVVPMDEEIDGIIERLRFLKPDIVGISVSSIHYWAAIKVTREIQKNLKIPVIWGGLHPSIAPEECIEFADLICRGEGEETILELAEKVHKGSDITKIRNLWIRKGNKIIKNDVRLFIQDLDTLPFPDYENKDVYCVSMRGGYIPLNVKWGTYHIMASRGCQFSCAYCTENLIRKIYKGSFRYRKRSAQNVIAELNQAQKKYNIKSANFHDSTFPHETEWIKDFSYIYKEKVGLPFLVRMYPTVIKKENVDLLVKAGLSIMGTSLESASERVRKEVFHRGVTDSKFIDTHKFLTQYKRLKIYHPIIIDNPFETEEDKKKAFDLLMKLSGTFTLVPFSLCYYPKTDITERALREKKITGQGVLQSVRWSAPDVLLTQKRTNEERHWNSLVYLLILYHRYHLFPKKVIEFISKNSLLKKHPHLLFVVLFYARRITMRVEGYMLKIIKAVKHPYLIPKKIGQFFRRY